MGSRARSVPRRPLGRAVLVVLALLAVGCTSGGGPPAPSSIPTGAMPPSTAPTRGGVYRTAIEDFGFTDGFDPTGEHAGTAWGLYSQLLLRTLLTYRHVAGPAGEQVVPDLATSVPAPTDGGLTYTFHLKAGVRFGPPLDRPITSRDIAYAFQRINTRSLM